VKRAAALASAAAALVAAVPDATAAAAAARYALVFSNNAGDAGEAPLRYADADARRLSEVLSTLGDFPPGQVLLLRAATAAQVRGTLIRLNASIRERGGDDLLFVFYSGHADAEALHLGGSRLPVAELRDLVAGSPAATRVLVLDSCRSGGLTRVKGGRAVAAPAFQVQTTAPPGARGVAILTSSAAGEDAQESDALGASFYTHYLISALRGAADRDGDGRVTLGEAFTYASERTVTATATTVAGPQHPTFRLELGGREDLVLTRPGAHRGDVGRLVFARPGWYLVQTAGDDRVVAEVSSQQPERQLGLEPGRYLVTLRAPDHLRQATLSVAAGGVTRVAAAEMRRIDYAQVVRKGGAERRAAWSAFVAAGARGPIAELGPSWLGDVGVRLDRPTFSLEARFGAGRARRDNERLAITTDELAGSLAALRAIDLRVVTVALGLEGGGGWLRQRFGDPLTPDRLTAGLFLAPLAVVEARLLGRGYLRLDAGLRTYFLKVGASDDGAGRRALVTVRATAGLGIYF
jgi:hypothetical protein